MFGVFGICLCVCENKRRVTNDRAGPLDPEWKLVTFYERSEVTFAELSRESIEAYVATGEPLYVPRSPLSSRIPPPSRTHMHCCSLLWRADGFCFLMAGGGDGVVW